MFLHFYRVALGALLILLLLDAVTYKRVPLVIKSMVRRVYSLQRLPGRPPGRLNIAVVTRFSDDGFRHLSEQNFAKFCRTHNYDLIILNDYPELNDELETTFGQRPFGVMSRILLAPAVLDNRLYDWLLWVDEDTLFLNMKRRLEEVTDNRYDLIVSCPMPDNPDIIPDAPRHLLVRNSKEAHEILKDLHKLSNEHCGQFIIDNPGAASSLNGWLQICNSDGTFWNGDSGLLMALITFRPAEYRCRIKKINHRIMSSNFPEYEDGDLALCFPDHMKEARKRLMETFLLHTDFRRGVVDRSNTEKLDPVDPGIGDWSTLEDIYDLQLNVPCKEE